MRNGLKLMGAFVILLFVVICPERAKEAVTQAMSVWAFGYVPALLPVFVVSPALVSAKAVKLYEDILGGFTQKAFGVPAKAAAAVAVGLMTGSPAGCACLEAGEYKKCEISRAGIMASGLSPAFLTATVGGFFRPGIGIRLAVAQTLAILSTGWLLREAWSDDDETVPASVKVNSFLGGVGKAAVDICGVLCWMALFGVIAAIPSIAFPRATDIILPVLEIASGVSGLTRSGVGEAALMIITAFLSGLGGVCVACQNLSRLKCTPFKRFALGKLLHATLTALYFPILCQIGVLSGLSVGYSVWPCLIAVVTIFILSELRQAFSRNGQRVTVSS